MPKRNVKLVFNSKILYLGGAKYFRERIPFDQNRGFFAV